MTGDQKVDVSASGRWSRSRIVWQSWAFGHRPRKVAGTGLDDFEHSKLLTIGHGGEPRHAAGQQASRGPATPEVPGANPVATWPRLWSVMMIMWHLLEMVSVGVRRELYGSRQGYGKAFSRDGRASDRNVAAGPQEEVRGRSGG